MGKGWQLGTAIVVGAFALGGTAAGSWLSNRGATDLQRAQFVEARRYERMQARGSARLLVRELSIALTYVAGVQTQGRWLGIDTERMDIEIRDEDLQNVARQVTGDEWGILLVAIGDSETAARLVRKEATPGVDLGRALNVAELATLAKIENSIQNGIRALAKVADAPPP